MSELDGGHRRNPYDSYAATLAAEYPPESDFGRALRRGDAKLRLVEMDWAEERLVRWEAAIQSLSDAAERARRMHDLQCQYLVAFGCRADERWEYRELLASVAERGDLSLFAAAQLAHTFHAQRRAVNEVVRHIDWHATGVRNGSDSLISRIRAPRTIGE